MSVQRVPSRLTLPPRELGPFDAFEVRVYVEAAGDKNPLHSDLARARSAGFDDILVPGLMLMGHIAWFVQHWPGCAEMRALTVRFLSPVLVGERLLVEGRVIAADRSSDEAMILRLKLRAEGRVAIMGEARVVPSAR